jgi:hypothetical protein
MFGKILSSLKSNDAETGQDSKIRRLHPRRSGDACVSIVDGKVYPVENWSYGGVMLTADDRMFSVDQEINMTMKFKLRGKVLDIAHKGRIVRKTPNKIALQFAPLSKKIQTSFQQVVDDFIAQQFIDSQTG